MQMILNMYYKSNKKQTMGTYAFNIYGWLIGMPTVPQRTIESKTNMQYIFKIICILQSIYVVYEINFEHLIGFSVFSKIYSSWS
jgi:hypothetical protein